MEMSSESMVSSAPVQSIESNIRNIRKKMKRMNQYHNRMDTEGGHCLEIIERDMVQMRKDFSHSISLTKQALTWMLEDLEIKYEKMELNVGKLEVVAFTGSSSRHDETTN